MQQRGFYRKTLKTLNDFSELLEKEVNGFKLFETFPIEDKNFLEMLVLFYLEYGLVTLKLSLLPLARKCVYQNNKLMQQLSSVPPKMVIQNGLILAKIEYWICRLFIIFNYLHHRYPYAVEILHAIQSFPEQIAQNLISETCEILLLQANTYRAWCKYEQASKVQRRNTFKIEHRRSSHYLHLARGCN